MGVKNFARVSIWVAHLCTWAVDFNYFTNFGHVYELVHQPLAIDFGQNAPLVVVPEKDSFYLVKLFEKAPMRLIQSTRSIYQVVSNIQSS